MSPLAYQQRFRGAWLGSAMIAAWLAIGPAAPGAPATQPAATASRPGDSTLRSGDWPMWGGRPDRNMVSNARSLPESWDVAAGRNVKWKAQLGSQTYGNVVVAGGKVFVGTNNGQPRDPGIEGDRGVLMCFAEADGRFLWQAVHDKLGEPFKHDWPDIGICSTPGVVGDRIYYVSNRCELICADTEGFTDGQNDGPVQDETRHGDRDADFVWRLDMRKDLGVVPFQASASAPLVVDDLVFVVTGNGIDDDSGEVAAPEAPSFIAVDRHTGRVVWQDASQGDAILAGQWSSPVHGRVNGRPQVVFPGGDGWLYAFDPPTGRPLWKFNCTAAAGEGDDDANEDENVVLATPVFQGDTVFAAIGQDPEAGTGPGRLWAIDATGEGDVTRSHRRWQVGGDDFGRTLSSVALRDGLLYVTELDGYLHCIDAATGARLWRHDLKAVTWSSPLWADDKVYVANEDGDVSVFAHGRDLKVLGVHAMNEAVHSTVVAAHGILYVVTGSHLYAIAEPARVTGDWPMFRGNRQLTGVATGSLPDELSVRWRFSAPDAVESSAAIDDGTVYVGCNDGVLYALDLDGGAVKWTYKAKGQIRSSPCVAGDTVFIGDDDGEFHAVARDTGRGRWTFRTDGEIISSPNHVDGKVLFGSYDGFVYCLSAADGALIWKTETEGRVHGTPGVADDRVLVAGCDERCHVLKLDDGSPVGQVELGSFSGASAAIRGSRVFVGTFNNQVLAVDWRRNRVVWRYEHAERHFPFYGSAAVTDDCVVIGGRDRIVHALDGATGKPRWTFATDGKIDASPVIVGGRVFIGSTDGVLYMLDLADGKEMWRFEAGGPLIASAAVGGECLVIGTEDGVIYCLGRKGGQP